MLEWELDAATFDWGSLVFCHPRPCGLCRWPARAGCWLEWGSSELNTVFLLFRDRIVYFNSTSTALHSLLLVAKTLQSPSHKGKYSLSVGVSLTCDIPLKPKPGLSGPPVRTKIRRTKPKPRAKPVPVPDPARQSSRPALPSARRLRKDSCIMIEGVTEEMHGSN
jgi:hypothetical protein